MTLERVPRDPRERGKRKKYWRDELSQEETTAYMKVLKQMRIAEPNNADRIKRKHSYYARVRAVFTHERQGGNTLDNYRAICHGERRN